jgi:uncharacterized protein YjlB
MIEAGTYNKFTIYAGANWDKTLTVATDGTPVNWTGYTAKMQIKHTENSAAVVTLTNGAGITLGGSAGTIAIAMTAAQTVIPAGIYRYDLELTLGSQVTRLLQGKITVEGQITT